MDIQKAFCPAEVGRSVETSAVEAEAEPTAAIRSRWAVDDDEDLPVANGQVSPSYPSFATLHPKDEGKIACDICWLLR